VIEILLAEEPQGEEGESSVALRDPLVVTHISPTIFNAPLRK
jgi:hypothetical protein